MRNEKQNEKNDGTVFIKIISRSIPEIKKTGLKLKYALAILKKMIMKKINLFGFLMYRL